ncbi:MAG: 4-alpha-glucanotransferase [Puniceicoccales bacterium]|jgi:4-alpha-glucanotransferase|nr:4-alpha-glucanotransferase [Puniceicoccales bacterium]
MDWNEARYVDDRCTLFQRESGVLLDIPSLPGGYGIGEIGPHALKFLHLLRDTGQKLWHIVSLRTFDSERLFTGTSYGWNTTLISFAWLRDDGLVTPDELAQFKKDLEPLKNNRAHIIFLRQQFLKQVAKNFPKRASPDLLAASIKFQKYNHLWLDKFSLFQTLGEEFENPWYQWPDRLRSFDRLPIEMAMKQLQEKIQEKNVLQFLFTRYWEKIRSEANYFGIRIMLSLPVFVAQNSYEVWSNQSLFYVDEDGSMTATSGICPNHIFPSGKLFRGPQYRWKRVKTEQYKFWINRFRRELQNVNIVFWEHFHALFECYEFPVDDQKIALENGRLVSTDDRSLLDRICEILQTKNIVASDIFESNLKMERAIRQLDMASAAVIPFCFSQQTTATQVFPKHFTQHHIAYSSNYFSDSLLQWLKNFSERLSPDSRSELQRCFGTDLNRINRNGLLHLRDSGAGAVMTTLPDVLELEQRCNEFLSWRFEWEQITDVVKTRLLQLSQR